MIWLEENAEYRSQTDFQQDHPSITHMDWGRRRTAWGNSSPDRCRHENFPVFGLVFGLVYAGVATYWLTRAGLGIDWSRKRLELLRTAPKGLTTSAKIYHLTWGAEGKCKGTPPSRSLSGFARIVIHCFLQIVGDVCQIRKRKGCLIHVRRATYVVHYDSVVYTALYRILS